MKLNVLGIDKDVIRLKVEGSITSSDFQTPNSNVIAQAVSNNYAQKVALDLGDVNYIDSSAIGWLMAAHKAFNTAGGKLVIHSIQPAVRQILDLLRIGRVLTLVEDEPAAKAALESAKPAQ